MGLALTLMLFFAIYFFVAKTPDKPIFGNYKRSRRLMGVALLVLAANYSVHLFAGLRFKSQDAAILMNLSTYFLSYWLFASAMASLLNRFYISETMACSEKGPKLSQHGKARLEMMDFVLKQNKSLSEDAAMVLLNGVSQAESPTDVTSHTQWSVVYNLSQGKATICVNRDYKNKFTFQLK